MYKKRKLPRGMKKNITDYRKGMQMAAQAVQKMMAGGHLSYGGGGHYNSMAPFYGANQDMISYMASPIHGIRTHRDDVYGWPIHQGGGMINPRSMGIEDHSQEPYPGRTNSFYNRDFYPADHMWGFLQEKFPIRQGHYGMGGMLQDYNSQIPVPRFPSMNQTGGMMYQQGGRMPMGGDQDGDEMGGQGMPSGQESSQHMASLAQGQTGPSEQQAAMEQQQQMQQKLMQLAQAVASGDPQAIETLKQLPPEIQQQVIQMVQQMRQQQGDQQMYNEGQGQGAPAPEGMEQGPPPAQKRGGMVKKRKLKKKMGKMSFYKIGGYQIPV